MDAKETINYLYEHSHKPKHEHLITILRELSEVERLRDLLREIAGDAQKISESIDKALLTPK